MRFLLAFAVSLLINPAFAQENTPAQEQNISPKQEKLINWYDYPEAELRALDKVTAKATTFKVQVGKPAKFGKIYMKVQTCRKPPAIDKVDSAAFVQVWEKPPKATESKWVFSGWMFASSPSLSAMDHPIYDVWLLDCIGPEPKIEEEEKQSEEVTETVTEETETPETEEEKSAFDSILDSLESSDDQ